MFKTIFTALIFLLILNTGLEAEFIPIGNQTGLEWAEFDVFDSDSNRILMYLLRIDPECYEFDLLSSLEYNCPPRSAQAWAVEYNYLISFNAGMYAEDHRTTIGYCKVGDFVINDHLNRHNCILAFDALNNSASGARIINRKCENFDSLRNHYNSFLQSIRMLGCSGVNTWRESDDRHSILALAEDKSGDILVIFCRNRISVHDFIDIVSGLSLNLEDMMYLEGSYPASLYVHVGDFEVNLTGYGEQKMLSEIFKPSRSALPNVIAVRKKINGD